jgi:hypothetical protein
MTPPSTSWYRDAIPIARANGRNYDPVAQTAWTAYVVKRPGCGNCPETWRQVWYDDVDSFRAKAEFADEQGMRGVGMWALGYTGAYPGLWNVIGILTGAISDDTPPTGTASVAAGAAGTEQDLPIVTGDVTLRLEARDTGGSGLAFVRIANAPTLDDQGSLVEGYTWPATASVDWSLDEGPVVVPPKVRVSRSPSPTEPPLLPTGSAEPGASAGPDASGALEAESPSASPAPSVAPPVLQGARSILVQWRDVAGNWSAPISVDVWYAPKGSVMPPATPSPMPTEPPSAPPSVAPAASAEAPASQVPVSPPPASMPAPSELLESATAP